VRSSRRFATLAAAACALVVGAPAQAQEPSGFPAVELERVEAPEPGKLRLFVTELDARGAVPADPPNGFTLWVDENEVGAAGARFSTFAETSAPMTVVWMIQLGGTASELFPAVKEAVVKASKALPPSTSVAVVAYAGHRIALDVEPTDPATAVKRLDGLSDDPDPEQFFGEAIEKVLPKLKVGDTRARKVVVLVSDGLWSDSDEKLGAVAGRRLIELEARVHVLSLKVVPSDAGATRLRRLVQASRGTLRVAEEAAQVEAQLGAIGAQLRQQHVVDVELAQVFDGALHQLELKLRPDGKKTAPLSVNVGKQWVSTWSSLRVPLAIGLVVVVVVALAFVVVQRRRQAIVAGLATSGSGPTTTEPDNIKLPRPAPTPEANPTLFGLEGQADLRAAMAAVNPPAVNSPAVNPFSAPEPRGGDPRGRGASAMPSARPRAEDARPPIVPTLDPSGDGTLPPLDRLPALPDAPGALASADQIAIGSGTFRVPSFLPGGAPAGAAGGSRPGIGGLPGGLDGSLVRPSPLEDQSLNGLPSPTQFLERLQLGADLESTHHDDGPAPLPPGPPVPTFSAPPTQTVPPTFEDEGAPTMSMAVPDYAALARDETGPASLRDVVEVASRPLRVTPEPQRSSGVRVAATPPGGIAALGSPVSQPSLEGLSSLLSAVKKTQIVDPSELGQPDTIAWITYLDGDGETSAVTSEAVVAGVRFEVGADGRWSVDGAPCDVGRVIELGRRRAVFGWASRFPSESSVVGPRLRVIGGLDDGRVVALPLDAPLVVGADASAGLVVRGPGIERRHVVVRLDGDALEVVDLASKAGVRVGRDTVRRARLEANAELFVGSVRLQYLR
jgi:hypothetical protein